MRALDALMKRVMRGELAFGSVIHPRPWMPSSSFRQSTLTDVEFEGSLRRTREDGRLVGASASSSIWKPSASHASLDLEDTTARCVTHSSGSLCDSHAVSELW